MKALAASWALLTVVFLTSCRREAEIDKAPRLGQGRSVQVIVRQADVSQETDGRNQILACLIWAERLRVNLSEIEHEPPTGIKKVGDKFVPLTVEDLEPIKAAADLPILIVVRRNREGRFSWGLRNSFPPGEDSYIRIGGL